MRNKNYYINLNDREYLDVLSSLMNKRNKLIQSGKTVDEMASQYGFNQEQKDYLTELLKPENNSLWAAALYGINYSDDQIVTVALTQIGKATFYEWLENQTHYKIVEGKENFYDREELSEAQ